MFGLKLWEFFILYNIFMYDIKCMSDICANYNFTQIPVRENCDTYTTAKNA